MSLALEPGWPLTASYSKVEWKPLGIVIENGTSSSFVFGVHPSKTLSLCAKTWELMSGS